MKVLVACECSGIVRDAFRANGHDAWSCDLAPAETASPYHFEGSVQWVLGKWPDWDLLIAHPPCRYLSVSGQHWNGRKPGRLPEVEKALEFARAMLFAPVPKRAIENPVGIISTKIMPASQYIQPYQFGHDASKKTGLWLFGLPLLKPTREIAPRIVNGKPRWANQTDSGQNKLGPSPTRSADRARTYGGIAQAMAEQWG